MKQFIYIFLGALSWTLCEYILHRFIGHSKTHLGGFTREHRDHHKSGDYFMPLHQKIWITFKVIGSLACVSSLLLGLSLGVSYTLGFGLCFAIYEVLHKRAHTHPPQNRYGRWLRRHHFTHHFSAPRKNFGVTTPLWDLIFFTYTPAGQIRLPAKKAMAWLVDPHTREIYSEFTADYQFRSSHSKRHVIKVTH